MTTPSAIDPAKVLPFPAIHIVLNDHQPRVEISGTRHELDGTDLDTLRAQARARVAQTAHALDRPVQATAHEPSGSWQLIVHPDGTLQEGPAATAVRDGRGRRLLPLAAAAAVAAVAGAVIALGLEATATGPQPTPASVTLTPSPAPTVTKTTTARVTIKVTARVTVRVTTRVTIPPKTTPPKR